MTISLRQIRYFVAAAECGQISLAAVSLNVSQSAVTAAVRQLEADLGVALFERRPSGVVPTLEGNRFLQHARHIMAAVDQAVREPRNQAGGVSGSVRVGVTYTVAGYFLPRYLARFASSFPAVELQLIEAPRDEIECGLAEGSLDIAVMLVSNLRAHNLLLSEVLVRSSRRLWLHSDHALLHAEQVSLADVVRRPYIMLTVDEAEDTASRYWASAGIAPQVIFRTSSVEAVRSMVAAGMGITILSDMVHRPWSLEGQKIETRDIASPIPSMDVGLVTARGTTLHPATNAFRDFLISACT